jgi:hypothetical protein
LDVRSATRVRVYLPQPVTEPLTEADPEEHARFPTAPT